MTAVNIYLNFDGNCLEAFEFYRTVFGGDFPYVGTYGEMPIQEGMPEIPEEIKNKIMHISLPISKETMLLGSDVGGGWAPKLKVGNNFSIATTADSKEEADRLFNALSKGGVISMPLAETFWGDYFGTFTDKFDINWMITCPIKRSED